MKDFFGELGNNPKFNTMTKLAFYSLFVFIAIILINTADVSELNNEVDNNGQEEREELLVTLPGDYEYSYSINIDDKIYSYQGTVEDTVRIFKKNKNNKITNYKYDKSKYYMLEKEEYVEVLEKDVYDIVNYSYLDVEKINYYLANAVEKDEKYYTYLKDSITGEETEEYIEIIREENKTIVDYSKLDDEYEKFVVEFEYKERKDEGESDEN